MASVAWCDDVIALGVTDGSVQEGLTRMAGRDNELALFVAGARAFAAWAVIVGLGGCSDDSGDRAPTTPGHLLRVQGNGAGSGTVSAPDASPPLSCTITRGALSGVCANAYPSNSAVALVATPNGASTFSGWTGACTGSGQCVVDMSQERTVTASFEPPPTGPAIAAARSWSSRATPTVHLHP